MERWTIALETVEWWAAALVWLACAVGCLLLGDRQGKPGKALAFGLLFGPIALGVVLSEARTHPGPAVRAAWFARTCLTVGQVLSVLACAGSILACVWGILRLAEFGPGSLVQPLLVVLSGILSFFFHAGLWAVFSWVKRYIFAGPGEPVNGLPGQEAERK